MENKSIKKLRCFGHPWHLAHNYALANLPFLEWYWLRQYKRPYSTQPRGDFMVNWVDHYEPGVYDFALLHVDQQCFADDIYNRGKGVLYRDLNEVIQDIPKIVINHATPFYPEKFPNDIFNDEYAKHGISSKLIAKCKEVVGDNTMVVNSHLAQKQWGYGNTIIHGLPEKMFDLTKEPRVVTMISPGGLDGYYDRVFLDEVKNILVEKGYSHCHITVDFIPKDFDQYREFLGSSLVYFNPTKESPMPRARTEAMLSGCCVITTPNQDADTFIEDGINGFLCDRSPEAVVEKIIWCFENYDKAVAIGQAGKKTAEELFSFERYSRDWENLLTKVLKK